LLISREVEIERPLAEVFAFVSDARNDVRWCKKVKSVEQVGGDGPGTDARYAVVHKPVPGRPSRVMEMSCVWWDPPHRLEWRQDDGTDVFRVAYTLEDLGGRTRLAQRSDAEISAPKWLHPLYKAGIGRDLAGQLKRLKKLLEDEQPQ
jgi:hypothetical protein